MGDTRTMLVLAANEPRSYRELVVATLRELRPDLRAVAVAPEELDREIARLRPDLVVCSRLTGTARTLPLSWVLLYPDGASGAVTSVSGEQEERAGMDIDAFLAVVDRTRALLSQGR